MMRRGVVRVLALLAVSGNGLMPAQQANRRHVEAAGPGNPAAVVTKAPTLIQTAQLLPAGSGSASEQVRELAESLRKLLAEAGSEAGRLVRLNVYAIDSDSARTAQEELSRIFSGDPRPVISLIISDQTRPGVRVSLDAVAESDERSSVVSRKAGRDSGWAAWAKLPMARRGAVFVAGQASTGELRSAARTTMESLHRTLEHLQLPASQVVQLKVFLEPMSESAVVLEEMARFYEKPAPPVTFVQWKGGNNPLEIEVVAAGREGLSEPIAYITPPGMTGSPIFSRVAWVGAGVPLVFTSGLHGRPGTGGEAQIRDIFAALSSLMQKAGSDLHHLAKATYYVADDESSRKLNEVRPEFYDPKRPPAASKAAVRGSGVEGITAVIDMIAAAPH